MTTGVDGILRFGADEIESEPVGTYDVRQRRDGSIAVTITFRPKDLERELIHGGILPEGWDAYDSDARDERKRELTSLAAQRVGAFRLAAPKHLLMWITTTLAWDDQVRRMKPEEFLTWIGEYSPHQIPRALMVPAVQEQIALIREKGPASRRSRLADILAVRASGRPLNIPPARHLYLEVRKASETLKPLHVGISESTVAARRGLWRVVKSGNPSLADALERLTCATKSRAHESLRVLWFDGKAPTLNQMACQLVAARHGLSWQTVERAAGSIRAVRDPKRRAARRHKEELPRWREALEKAHQATGE